MKHFKDPDEGRVYDETTHQWVEAGEPSEPKAVRRSKAKPAEINEAPQAADAAPQATTEE